MISAATIDYLKKGIFTILGLMVAVYLFVILLTYTGNDPSWSHISSDMTTINNMGGAMGAWLSDLLYSFFGFGAWWLLAFLVYESILIWWDNKPTFWLLRLVAYVFLLLSASALFAQLIALIQQVVDPISTGLQGVAGGIIGLELQARLAHLLSKWGSMAFLTVFVIITATFAFNIHWQALYYKLTRLSWLGSGLRVTASSQSSITVADDLPQQGTNLGDKSVTAKDDLVTSKMKRSKLDFGQLPLELDATQLSTAPETHKQSRFGNVLTDFLTKSGLGESVKASMAAATEAAANSRMRNDNLQTATVMPNSNANTKASNSISKENASNDNFSNNNTNLNPTVASSSVAPLRKVEPSFAWNDPNMVDDLLTNQFATDQQAMESLTVPSSPEFLNSGFADASQSAPVESVSDQAMPVDDLAEYNSVEESYVEPSYVEQGSAATDSTDTFSNSSAIDSAVVSSPAAISAAAINTVESASTTALEQEITAALVQPTVARKVRIIVPSETEAQIKSAALSTEQHSTTVDMTPTNTPPSDPKAAPTADVKPTFSFAVPDGDSSNHIEDMMPEDYSTVDDMPVPTMAAIHDDAAFTTRSRSMQTAAYRASLSPIPSIAILDKPDPNRQPSYTEAELEQLSELLEIKLQEFNVKANVVNAIPGPVVTRFEVDLAAGIKASKVTGISRDLARSLSMASLRVVEVIPGKPYIGIEVPNKQREMVRLIELLDTEKFKDSSAQISMAMGKDIGGKAIITDLARAPHMLVAGTTGSGKSVLVNAMLLSMLLKYTPNELRLILIDPKQLELANYNDIPHLLTPVVTDMTEAASSLSWCVAEMERRYQLMSLLKVRKLNEFNKKVIAAEQAGNPMLDPLWRPNDNVSISQAPKLKTLPMIVIVADEFADMIMQVGKQAEELITRLAQKSRAAGIHLILATQRPSVDVITGLIKANIPVRAALRVNSKVDSRTILDSGGAEDMLGNGDMLFLGPGQIEPDRVHGAYVSDEEVNSVCDAWRERGAPDYIDNMAGNFELSSPGGGSTGSPSGEDDDLYNEAVGFIMETRKVSASSIQRKFSIGYNRAARIVDSMEEAGLVSSMGKSGKRELLM
ncbi:DNA translocase FtsK 4TM domain-containing protein [Psychrobacter sp. TAE2020]|uniref:DNA translocase FtsK 4TM domain-containing protein n=1 Tax=Psychrobacter sp. TAE2020 TaxID=2846762 RepID=UPI001C1157D0|nr:DNA translocase FtsK [Psychrobacter sp. TAE2020]MBU5616660.1 DNA translocase FtsK 4TM domain-containing protein [Psychrobacter sp. TAE2020]